MLVMNNSNPHIFNFKFFHASAMFKFIYKSINQDLGDYYLTLSLDHTQCFI